MFPIRTLISASNPQDADRPAAYGDDIIEIARVSLSQAAPKYAVGSGLERALIVTDGEVELTFGGELHRLSPFSAAYLSADVPFELVAQSADAVLLEVAAKGRPFGVAEQPADDLNGQPFVVHSTPDDSGTATGSQRLITNARGSSNIYLGVVDMPSGKGAGPMHIHPFDQFQITVSGRANIAVANSEFVLEPWTMAVLPAGVPHHLWNEDPSAERHLSVNIGYPLPIRENQRAWDYPVALQLL